MAYVVYVAGLLVIYGGVLLVYRRVRTGMIADELRAFAGTVPAPLGADVRAWLEVELDRRDWYPMLGLLAGAVFANQGGPGNEDLSWDWYAVLLGIGFGTTAGILVAGLRTAPLVEGSLRTVDPERRRVPDHFGPSDTRQLRLAVVVSLSALLLVVAVVSTSEDVETVRPLLGAGLGALLVGAHYGVAAVMLARPMMASTPEGLIWQQALLAKTLKRLPLGSLVDAVCCAAIALTVAFSARADLAPPVLVLAGFVAVLAVVAVVAAVVGLVRGRQQSQAHPAGGGSTS